MKILLLAHAFNSLTQRLWVELQAWGHAVSVEFDVNDATTADAVASFAPDVVLAPFLKRAIPAAVWQAVPCLVVHPGIVGDRGPSALDHAVQDGAATWGVTVLQADAEFDAGDVWASATFAMRAASKGSLYRNEVTEAAVQAVAHALDALAGGARPTPVDPHDPAVTGRARPLLRQAGRVIDWTRDDTATVLRRIRAADGVPGVLDRIGGVERHLYDAHAEGALRGPPGELLARREGAVCRATVDGAVWITHLKDAADPQAPFKRPATDVLPAAVVTALPELPLALDARPAAATWRDLWYEEHGAVGVLHFPFYNGALSTRQCERLQAAVLHARARPTRVLVLAGGPDFWCNGIHLNTIEADPHPAEASLRNIEAIDDVALAVLTTDRQWTIAALQGNAGAGGVFLALAADTVWARSGVVLNPHYKGMGNLYGSEYWTYLLPRRTGPERARTITAGRLPVGSAQALAWGLLDDHFGATPAGFLAQALARAQALAADPALPQRLAAKAARRAADEASRPLAAYRADELARMRLNFFGFDPSYHVARSNFVRKVPKARTPLYLARHRAGRGHVRAATEQGSIADLRDS